MFTQIVHQKTWDWALEQVKWMTFVTLSEACRLPLNMPDLSFPKQQSLCAFNAQSKSKKQTKIHSCLVVLGTKKTHGLKGSNNGRNRAGKQTDQNLHCTTLNLLHLNGLQQLRLCWVPLLVSSGASVQMGGSIYCTVYLRMKISDQITISHFRKQLLSYCNSGSVKCALLAYLYRVCFAIQTFLSLWKFCGKKCSQ